MYVIIHIYIYIYIHREREIYIHTHIVITGGLLLLRDLLHEPEVQDAELAVRREQEVARVRVAVEEACMY